MKRSKVKEREDGWEMKGREEKMKESRGGQGRYYLLFGKAARTRVSPIEGGDAKLRSGFYSPPHGADSQSFAFSGTSLKIYQTLGPFSGFDEKIKKNQQAGRSGRMKTKFLNHQQKMGLKKLRRVDKDI